MQYINTEREKTAVKLILKRYEQRQTEQIKFKFTDICLLH